MLLTDGCLRLYAHMPAGGLLQLEQEWFLSPAGAPAGGALRPPLPPAPAAVDFAFLPAHGWAAAALLLLFADGAVRVLCPLLPWGALLPRALVASLRAAAAEASADQQAQHWLQLSLAPPRATPPALFAGTGAAAMRARPGDASRTPLPAARASPAPRQLPTSAVSPAADSAAVRVAPAALPSAVPALQGPLPLSPDAGGAAALGAACAVSATGLVGAGCEGAAVVVVAHACGSLRVLVLPQPPQPRWAQAAPVCERTLGGALLAARSPAFAAGGAPAACPPLLAIDTVLLAADTAPVTGLTQLCWEAQPGRRLFCAMGGRLHVLDLAWLPAVERLLAEGGGAEGGAAVAPEDTLPLPQARAGAVGLGHQPGLSKPDGFTRPGLHQRPQQPAAEACASGLPGRRR